MLVSLIATETSCKNKGATVSGDLAKAAAALTCKALQDANEVNVQMENLGKICTDAFTRRNQMQQMLQESYADMISDVEDGTDYILKSQILMEDCPKESKKAKALRQRARELAVEIANVELRSRDGKDNYGKFKDAAAAMAMLTAARNKGCSTDVIEKVTANREQRASPLPVSAAGAPSRKPKSGPSDITGVIDDDSAFASGAAHPKIERPKFNSSSEISGRTPSGAEVNSRSTRSQARSGISANDGNARDVSGRKVHLDAADASKLANHGVTSQLVDRVQPKPEELLGDLALLAGKQGVQPESAKTVGSGTFGFDSNAISVQGSLEQGQRTPSSLEADGTGETLSELERNAAALKAATKEEVLDGVSELKGLRENQNSADAVVGLDNVDVTLFKRVSARYQKLGKRIH